MKGGIFILTLKADFNELKLNSEKLGMFTSGSVNAYKVRFELSDDWETLRVIPVFRAGKTEIIPDVRSLEEWNENFVITIPWEIFREENIGERVYAGLIGMNSEDYVVTTVYALIGHVFKGASETESIKSSTPSVIQKLISEEESLRTRLAEIEALLTGWEKFSFYDYAAESGYVGTEEELRQNLANMGNFVARNNGFVWGNLMAFDSNGNAENSGRNVYDFAEVNHTHSNYAPLASPSFTGTPKAPTAASGANSTQIATTAFVKTALSGYSVSSHTHNATNITVSADTAYTTSKVRGISLNTSVPASISNGMIAAVYE